MKNIAFIDGQNLHLGIMEAGWKIDLVKLRGYLREKYSVKEAYYFLGFLNEDLQDLYSNLQKAGFIIMFREHNPNMAGKKKGNVDTDIVFEMMKSLIERKDFQKMVLVSGDGDYKKAVDYLVEKERLARVLFPNGRKASSLYNGLDSKYKLSLSRETVRKFIEMEQ